MDINTCYELTLGLRPIAYYSHLVPTALALFLSIYSLFRTRFAKLSVLFFLFTAGFSLWLIGDLFPWASNDYHLIHFTWSWLDYVNIVFFALGTYFFAYLARGGMSLWEKVILVAICIPAFVITVTNHSLLSFNQPVCEAYENDVLTVYKLFAEWIVVLLILFSGFVGWKKSERGKRMRIITVMGAILLFFAVFSSTEFLATITDIYEINLYGLFVLPVFLIVMVFSITNLGVFEFRLLGTQILSYALIIMVGSQFFFLQDSTEGVLSLVTFVAAVIFGVLLLHNAQKEEQARLQIERLAKELDQANRQQIILIHFITHQVKGFMTKSRNIFSLFLDGDYGPIPENLRPMIEEGFRSDTKGVNTIQEILNAANIKSGKVIYNMSDVDLKAIVEEVSTDLRAIAEGKGLAFNLELGSTPVMVKGDRLQLLNALKNLMDNSIKYTLSGSVTVKLAQEAGKIRFVVEDTGVGITKEDMHRLFTEGGHGTNSQKVNVESTGFGLYIVKNIIEAHHGKVWAESEGEGKGSRFIVELPV